MPNLHAQVAIALIGTYGCHAMLAFTMINPYVPIGILGFMYSLLACSLWPMTSLVVPERSLGVCVCMHVCVYSIQQRRI